MMKYLGLVVCAGAVVVACSSDDSNGNQSAPTCPTGTQSCACHSTGLCDPGLDCVGGICVLSGTGGMSGTGGVGTGGTIGSGGATGGTVNGTGGLGTGGTVEGTGGGTGDGTPVGTHGHLSVSGTHLVDQHGSNVQLRGISSQWLNLEEDGYALDPDALIWMRDNWGISVFRAAMGAEQVGEQPGYTTNDQGRQAMQTQVDTIVENAVAAGVYVIVDWHSHHAIEQQSDAIAFFTDMAKRYGQHPNVLFEPFNEPLQVEWSQLKSYHEAVVTAIRNNDADDNDNVVVLGTANWAQFVDEAAASPVNGANLMYTLHFYSCTHTTQMGTDMFNNPTNFQRAHDALNAGLPIFITEWGATAADGGVGGTEVCSSEADGWLDWADQNQISWVAWKLDDCDTEEPPDTSCLLQRNAPLSGGWTNSLNGHGPYVVGRLQR